MLCFSAQLCDPFACLWILPFLRMTNPQSWNCTLLDPTNFEKKMLFLTTATIQRYMQGWLMSEQRRGLNWSEQCKSIDFLGVVQQSEICFRLARRNRTKSQNQSAAKGMLFSFWHQEFQNKAVADCCSFFADVLNSKQMWWKAVNIMLVFESTKTANFERWCTSSSNDCTCTGSLLQW